MAYPLFLFALICVYIALIVSMRRWKNPKMIDLVFAAVIFLPYATELFIVYSDVGFYDWNFRNVLPTANVSPFMFSITPLTVLLPENIRKRLLLLFSLLSVGMLLSTTFNCIYNTVISYRFHFHFALDYISHAALSLWGVYAVRCNRVKLEPRSCIISGSIIFGVAALMLILNLIFDTAFFGLSLNGKHNIYNVVITDVSLLSVLIYFVGLVGVLFMGFYYNKLLELAKTKEKVTVTS